MFHTNEEILQIVIFTKLFTGKAIVRNIKTAMHDLQHHLIFPFVRLTCLIKHGHFIVLLRLQEIYMIYCFNLTSISKLDSLCPYIIFCKDRTKIQYR